jgi:hypothetical protein
MPGPQINTLRRIDSVWMAVSVDDDGTEGVCAFLGPNGNWMPLLAADEGRLPFIREYAAFIAKRDQRLVRIVRLTTREEVEAVDGRQ